MESSDIVKNTKKQFEAVRVKKCNETWIFQHNPETMRGSMDWKSPAEQ